MSYKPNFCCQCGEKIERVDWLLKSRRFCELCATDYGIYDKIPWILVIAFGVFGVFGVGTYMLTPEKTLNLSQNNLIGSVQNANKDETNRNISTVQPPEPKFVNPIAIPPAQNSKAKPAQIEEAVYYCGAATKKGTPCSRRVKGGGRCWQHAGQTAMLAQEKLKVGND